MKHDLKKMSKKQLKDYVNSNGFFTSALIQKNAAVPTALKDQIPEGAIYFKAIASNGELNRNGYIIRESAWKKAIAGYMENAVILLQHDMDQPIGRGLSAKVTKEGLVIEGFIYDEHTNGRFGQGLFNAVSTGHLTEAVEFQNEKTGLVIDEESFRALPWDEKMNGNWVMAVTALDWLENSIVSIGANRKSLVLAKDLVKNYVEALKFEEDADKAEIAMPAASRNEIADDDDEDEGDEDDEIEEEAEEVVEKTPEEIAAEAETTEEKEEKKDEEEPEAPVEEKKDEEEEPTEPIETPVEEETDETDTAEEPVAEVEGGETNAIKAPESGSLTLTKEEVNEFNGVVTNLINLLKVERKKTADLNKVLDSIPLPKGIVLAHANGNGGPAPKQKLSAIGSLLQANGIKVNS